MSGSIIRLPRTPLSFRARRRAWFSLAVVLALITGCESQSTTPDTPTIAPLTVTAIALPTTPSSPAPAATASGEQANRPARELLEQHALGAATYPPGDPAACGLPQVEAPADPKASGRVFWGCTPTTGPVLSAVPARQIPVASGSDPKEAALRALLAGPTDDERQAGYLSNFGAASQNVEFTIETPGDGLVVVDFDAAIRDVEFIFVSNMDATQIVTTLGQFPEAERVTILIDGQLLCQVTEQC